MTIYIAHLYYDLMNLYGEVGNIKVLEKTISEQGVKVVVDKVTKGEKIDFNKYDLIYIGSGTEENQLIVLSDFIKYKNKIRDFIENNKFLIATGNSYELFGKSINHGVKHTALGIFDYSAKKQSKRLVGDIIAKCSFINKNIIGFINQSGIIENNKDPMFSVLKGSISSDGLNYKNFYGTYLLGPILARNPMLNKYIISNLFKLKNIKLKKIDLNLDEEAYNMYMKTYHS